MLGYPTMVKRYRKFYDDRIDWSPTLQTVGVASNSTSLTTLLSCTRFYFWRPVRITAVTLEITTAAYYQMEISEGGNVDVIDTYPPLLIAFPFTFIPAATTRIVLPEPVVLIDSWYNIKLRSHKRVTRKGGPNTNNSVYFSQWTYFQGVASTAGTLAMTMDLQQGDWKG